MMNYIKSDLDTVSLAVRSGFRPYLNPGSATLPEWIGVKECAREIFLEWCSSFKIWKKMFLYKNRILKVFLIPSRLRFLPNRLFRKTNHGHFCKYIQLLGIEYGRTLSSINHVTLYPLYSNLVYAPLY